MPTVALLVRSPFPGEPHAKPRHGRSARTDVPAEFKGQPVSDENASTLGGSLGMTEYAYSPNGDIAAKEDPNGNVTYNTTNDAGKYAVTVDAMHHVSETLDDFEGRTIASYQGMYGDD